MPRAPHPCYYCNSPCEKLAHDEVARCTSGSCPALGAPREAWSSGDFVTCTCCGKDDLPQTAVVRRPNHATRTDDVLCSDCVRSRAARPTDMCGFCGEEFPYYAGGHIHDNGRNRRACDSCYTANTPF
jgi:hypothetical protein